MARSTMTSGRSWVRYSIAWLPLIMLTGFDEVSRIKKRIPMAEEQLMKVRELFDLYDSDADNSLNLNELAVLLQEIGNKITALPAVRSSSGMACFALHSLCLSTVH